jgi:uncharacterized protein YcgI (DUF1989 family)
MPSTRKLLEDVVVPYNTGRRFTIKRGQSIRIIGQTTVDFVALNLHNLRERFDQARTRSNLSKVYLSTGDALYSKLNNVMMTITEDTFPGRHDLQKGMCDAKRHLMVFRGESKRVLADSGEKNPEELGEVSEHGCWENLQAALEGCDIAPEDIPSPFNLFSNVKIDGESGLLLHVKVDLPEDPYTELRAEMDLLVAASHCDGGRGRSTRIQIYEA